MTQLIHILRMRVQICLVALHEGGRRSQTSMPWAGRDHVVFRGTLKIRSLGRTGVTEVALHSGTMLVYPVARGKPGGYVEIVYSGASEDRGFFGVTEEAFGRVLAVSLAHLSGHQSSMEIQFPLVRYSKGRSKVRLAQMSLSYGERLFFSEE